MPFDVHESQTRSQNSCKRDVKHSPYQPPGSRAGGGERTSAAEPSPLSPDSTIHIYGKGGERKEYIFRGLYNSSFAHQSLSFPSPPALRDGSYSPHPHTAVPPTCPTKENALATQMHPRSRAQGQLVTTQRPHIPIGTTASYGV